MLTEELIDEELIDELINIDELNEDLEIGDSDVVDQHKPPYDKNYRCIGINYDFDADFENPVGEDVEPGSEEKLQILCMRYQAGLQMFHPMDFNRLVEFKSGASSEAHIMVLPKR